MEIKEIKDNRHMKKTTSFGENLNLIRKLKHSTQVFISEKTGLSSRVIRNYEGGTRNPTNDSIQKIADALEVDIWALKDIDIDTNNYESVKQLFMKLEEKGIFDIDKVQIKQGNNSNNCLEYPISDEVLEYIFKWKQLKAKGGEEFERFKFGI